VQICSQTGLSHEVGDAGIAEGYKVTSRQVTDG